MLLKPILAGLLETTLNQYLALDEDAGLLLSPLTGKVIAVTFEPFNETLFLCPTESKIQILEQFHGKADTRITGSLAALGLMGMNTSSMRSIFNGDVRIEGDTQTGQRFQQLFKNLEIDLEEKLSDITGDILAHKIGNLFRSGHHWSLQTLETLRLNTEEFLQEESRDLPAKAEAEIFFRGIDELRSDYDRLEKRIERLQNTLEKTAEQKP